MTGRVSDVAGTRPTLSNPEPSSVAGPATTHLELGAMASAVPSARLHTRLVMGEWGLGHLTDSAELVVSELVTNGVQASQGLDGHWFGGQHIPGPPPVRLWLRSDGASVLVEVWDGSEVTPQPADAGPDQEYGRGLTIVQALAEETGVRWLDDATGKVCWAVVR